MRKVILFGDSLLSHFGKSLIKKLEDSVKDIDVFNCATGGTTTVDGINKSEYISKLRPDVVILCYGANDIFQNDLSPREYTSNMDKIIKNFSNSRIIIWITPPANDVNDKSGTIDFNSKISEYNDEIKNYCSKTGTEFIDSFSEYKIDIGKKDKYHEEGGIHLTKEGYMPFLDSLISILQ